MHLGDVPGGSTKFQAWSSLWEAVGANCPTFRGAPAKLGSLKLGRKVGQMELESGALGLQFEISVKLLQQRARLAKARATEPEYFNNYHTESRADSIIMVKALSWL